MSKLSTLALALTATAALALPAMAADAMTGAAPAKGGRMMKDGMVMMVMPDGKTSMHKPSDMKMADMMKQDGKMMDHPVMMMMQGGHMYMMDDTKMADGKMMSDEMMMKPSGAMMKPSGSMSKTN